MTPEQLQIKVTDAEAAVTAAVARLDTAEQALKAAEAEYKAAEAEAPKLTVTDLAKQMARDTQPWRTIR